MKVTNGYFSLLLGIALSITLLPAVFSTTVAAQDSNINMALQRGYRTGYSDGYMAGYRDTIDSKTKDIARHGEYNKADRAFNPDYGSIEDYRDGYQQGFESGYGTGFEKRSFESTMPVNISNRGTTSIPSSPVELIAEDPGYSNQAPQVETNETVASQPITSQMPENTFIGDNGAIIIIPRDTELVLELQNDLSTEKSREGEAFTAKVVSPSEIAGATIEGRVVKVRQPGRIKRRSELLLSFDRIVLNGQRWSNFNAVLVEVMPVRGDNIKLVDNEGTAIGKSSLKGDAVKVGGATGAGLVVGAVVGGPVGAAVGAGVGAAFGVGAVVIERGKHVQLNNNQQIRIKTAYETQIR